MFSHYPRRRVACCSICLLAVLPVACDGLVGLDAPVATFDGGQEASPCGVCSGTCTVEGRCAVTLTLSQAGPDYIAVGSTQLYWANRTTDLNHDNGTIGAVSLKGGSPTVLAPGMRPAGLALDSTSVYWANDSSFSGGDAAVLRMPLGGGSITTLASGLSRATAVAVAGGHAYWSSPTGVSRVPSSGGAVAVLVSVVPPQNVASMLAVDATNVYWAAMGPQGGSCLFAVPIDGGASVALESGCDPSGSSPIAGIAAANGDVFYTRDAISNTLSSSLLRVPGTGGLPTTLGSHASFVVSGPVVDVVSGPVVDAVHAYWLDNACSSTGGNCQQSLWRVPVGGGTSVALTHGATAPIALDATSVYWAGGGSVTRLTPK
jgi:hypothetical protein